FSAAVVSGEVYIWASSPTAAIRAIAAVILDSHSSLITPVAMRATTMATTTTAPPIHFGYSDLGSGFGMSWPAAPMVVLRMATYWMRPAAIPMAAMPKPQWKPPQPHTALVIRGPNRPPMLTPI